MSLTSGEIKIEPPEVPLNNDDTSADAHFVSFESPSNGVVEVKREVEMNYGTCVGESGGTLGLDSKIKQEMEEVKLKKKEGMDESDVTLEDESLRTNMEDFENISVPSTEEVFVKEEGNTELNEDPLLEDVAEKPNEKPKCDICEISFATKKNLKRHNFLKHSSEKPLEKSYKCQVCKKLFMYKWTLNTHMRTHTGEKCHKCEVCGQVFNIRHNYQNHMLIHTGEKPHKCNVCGRSFTNKFPLKRHMTIHTGEKSYKCEICEKLFSIKYGLQKHMLIHTADKPNKSKSVKCDVCEKIFTDKWTLKTHMKIHTGEKPHKCEICRKLFTLKVHLKQHMLIHTGEKPHRCVICGKGFCRNHSLKMHMLTHVNEKS